MFDEKPLDTHPWNANTAGDDEQYRYDFEQGLELNYNEWDLEWAPRPEFEQDFEVYVQSLEVLR